MDRVVCVKDIFYFSFDICHLSSGIWLLAAGYLLFNHLLSDQNIFHFSFDVCHLSFGPLLPGKPEFPDIQTC